MREAKVERHFARVVRALGGRAYKFKTPGRRGAEDRLTLLPRARIYFVETKAPGKKPEPHQAREHARKRALGFKVLVLDTIEKIDAWANRIAEENYEYLRGRLPATSCGMP